MSLKKSRSSKLPSIIFSLIASSMLKKALSTNQVRLRRKTPATQRAHLKEWTARWALQRARLNIWIKIPLKKSRICQEKKNLSKIPRERYERKEVRNFPLHLPPSSRVLLLPFPKNRNPESSQLLAAESAKKSWSSWSPTTIGTAAPSAVTSSRTSCLKLASIKNS